MTNAEFKAKKNIIIFRFLMSTDDTFASTAKALQFVMEIAIVCVNVSPKLMLYNSSKILRNGSATLNN